MFAEKVTTLPEKIKTSFSVGFVFFFDGENYHHFPARQWTEEQIKEYFLKRFEAKSQIIQHEELALKELIVENFPNLFVCIPYEVMQP